MIDLTQQNEHQREETLRRVKQGKYATGTVIQYHEGCAADDIGLQQIGRDMMALSNSGHVALVQKRIQDEPRRYLYWGVVV